MINEQRRSVRLELKTGTTRARYFGVPAFSSRLTDISEDGYACIAILAGLNASDAETWRTLLVPGFVLEADITVAPELICFHAEAEVMNTRWVTADELSLGL